MSELNRREFVGRVAVTAGAVAVGGAASADPFRLPVSAADKITLGKTGIKSSLVGIGTGSVGWNHQSNQTRLGQAKFTELIRHAFDNGIHFFDVADQYGSHIYLKEAIKGLPRDQFVIQSKIVHRTAAEARADLERFRKELGVDYIDTVLMHVVTEPDWNVRYHGVQEVLEEARQKGIIRAHGCSCHTIEALETASNDPWVQVDLARFNPWGKYMDTKKDQPEADTPMHVRPVLQSMRKAGKGVIGMKILAQGDVLKELSDSDRAAKARESIKHALSSGAVDMMVIGFESPKQITEVMAQTQIALNEIHQAIG
jgi:aryl-alcohol dehydrogenase-like predicted oxidoreductase